MPDGLLRYKSTKPAASWHLSVPIHLSMYDRARVLNDGFSTLHGFAAMPRHLAQFRQLNFANVANMRFLG